LVTTRPEVGNSLTPAIPGFEYTWNDRDLFAYRHSQQELPAGLVVAQSLDGRFPIRTGVTAEAIQPRPEGGFTVTGRAPDGTALRLATDRVIAAVGRCPYLPGWLGLDKAGVAAGSRGARGRAAAHQRPAHLRAGRCRRPVDAVSLRGGDERGGGRRDPRR
jgi:hypothetical protein